MGTILNKSDEPVYQVILTVVSIQGAGFPRDGIDVNSNSIFNGYARCLSILPSGNFVTTTLALDYALTMRFGLEISFTDAGGRHWVRKSNGSLIEIDQSPIDYYKFEGPIDWSFPISDI